MSFVSVIISLDDIPETTCMKKYFTLSRVLCWSEMSYDDAGGHVIASDRLLLVITYLLIIIVDSEKVSEYD